MTRPYPGLHTYTQYEQEIVIWQCQPFDGRMDAVPGTISAVFEDGSFLMNCGDGRVLVRDYTVSGDAHLQPKQLLLSRDFTITMRKIVEAYIACHRDRPLAKRIVVRC
ncbi:DNA-3-methyladenine glycosylase [Tepidimonas taiwanensis]|uniref:hypothetical protein n=1 Tax=Tepidimonas taiwanensis TaxID=307486 RepID=UPI001E3719BB